MLISCEIFAHSANSVYYFYIAENRPRYINRLGKGACNHGGENKQIGSVVTLNGTAWAVTDQGERLLSAGDPIYEGESVTTGKNANMEIRFLDGTLLGQGEEARVDLDEYIYDGSASGLDFHMVTGVLRMVSGKIAETNPESFNISTPLATIGIRGTEIIAKIDVNGQIFGVTDMSPGHYVVVATADGEVRIDAPGLFSGVDQDGFLIQTQELPQDFVDAVKAAVPLTGMGEEPRDPDAPPPEVPDPTGDSDGQGSPEGEPEPEEPEEQPEQSLVETPPPLAPSPPPPPAPVTAADLEGEGGDGSVPPAPESPDPQEPEDDDPVVGDEAVATTGEVWVDERGHATFHTGTALADSISGLDYDDTLKGEGGADSIDGGSGNDLIEGGVGADSLIGSHDADTFFYDSTLEGGDYIQDFGHGSDKIGLDSSADGFNSLTFDSGSLNSNNFYYHPHDEYDGTGLSDGDSVALVYASASGSTQGKLYFDPDINTPGDEVLLANIQETDSLGGADDIDLDASDIIEDGGGCIN